MIFNPDLTNHVQDVIFCRKTKKLLHPCLSFNDISLKNSISQKHLGMTLDVKLDFVEHIRNITQISTNPSKTIPSDYIQNIHQKSLRLCGCHLRPSIQLLLTRFRLGLSHLRDHKFRHCFQDTLNTWCGYNTEITKNFFLHCPSLHTPRQTFLNNITNINEQILSYSEDQLIQTFLYGNPNFNLTGSY